MKQLHAYITQALEEVQACIYYNQALCFGEASATVASTRAHQPAETASDPLKHELQNTRLQASASANARVHQSARTVSDPPKHKLQEHKLVIKQGSKQVQVQMQ